MSFFQPVISFIVAFPLIPIATAFSLLLCYVIYLHYKIHTFTRGENATSLESIIRECIESVSKIEEKNETISKHALSLHNKVAHAIRNTQTLRYKAFDSNGSNQSFSVALLNEKGNGVVITSLHVRDQMSTFAKPIEKYSSLYELTEEELHTVNLAKKDHQESPKDL